MMWERWLWMEGPATSAREPKAFRLVLVCGGRSRRGTIVFSVWGRTLRITRRPSSAWAGEGTPELTSTADHHVAEMHQVNAGTSIWQDRLDGLSSIVVCRRVADSHNVR